MLSETHIMSERWILHEYTLFFKVNILNFILLLVVLLLIIKIILNTPSTVFYRDAE